MSSQVPNAAELAGPPLHAPAGSPPNPPEFKQVLGHPRPLWMLFMSEFWERFAFYGMRWALTLYIVAQFFNGDASGEAYAGRTYGAFLALVYATAIFGGYVADRIIGYQRSIIVGAIVMAAGLFMITVENQQVFLAGLAVIIVGNGLFKPNISSMVGQLYAPGDARRDRGFTLFYMGINGGALVAPLLTGWLASQVFLAGLAVIIVGNGLFKPNISSMVGQLYAPGDARRDRGFTLFYMGINGGALVAPLLTGWLASQVFGTPMEQNYKVVFYATGVGMLISLVWFYIGRSQLKGIGAPPEDRHPGKNLLGVIAGVIVAIPVVYYLMAEVGAAVLAWILGALFIGLSVMLIGGALKGDKVSVHRVIAMLILFAFNVIFWCFFEQAGSSFNFLAQNIVDRDLFAPGGFVFPTGWFQSVNPVAIVLLAPVFTLIWAFTHKRGWEPSIPRKFGLGILGNALGFAVLIYALAYLVDPTTNTVPFWPLVLCYVLQTAGELCLSPIGLSMVTKLAPLRMVGLAMGGWFLSTAIGNNLSGLLAGEISGETGMTVASALDGFTFAFWLLLGAGVVLFLIAPLVNRLMHGVK